MDISYWTNYNPNISISETKKQYFGQYLWRLAIDVKGARLINDKLDDLSRALAHRRAMVQNYAYGGAWYIRKHADDINKIDVDQLYEIKQIRDKYRSQIRIRLEEPNVQIYAETESVLREIADEISNKFRSHVLTVCGPRTEEIGKLLKSGIIVSKTKTEYTHKVLLRDGRYSSQVKGQILEYLHSLGDIVKLSPGSIRMLNKPYPSMWGVFFYTNDPSITTFLSLISPGIILNIHELVQVE